MSEVICGVIGVHDMLIIKYEQPTCLSLTLAGLSLKLTHSTPELIKGLLFPQILYF